MSEELGPLEKQWLHTGLGNIADHVSRLLKRVMNGDLRSARHSYLDSMEIAITLAKRFPVQDAEEIAVTFVVNGEVVPVAVVPETPIGWARDMAIARYGGDPGKWERGDTWETRTADGTLLLGIGPMPVSSFAPGTEFYVTFPIGAGA